MSSGRDRRKHVTNCRPLASVHCFWPPSDCNGFPDPHGMSITLTSIACQMYGVFVLLDHGTFCCHRHPIVFRLPIFVSHKTENVCSLRFLSTCYTRNEIKSFACNASWWSRLDSARCLQCFLTFTFCVYVQVLVAKYWLQAALHRAGNTRFGQCLVALLKRPVSMNYILN